MPSLALSLRCHYILDFDLFDLAAGKSKPAAKMKTTVPKSSIDAKILFIFFISLFLLFSLKHILDYRAQLRVFGLNLVFAQSLSLRVYLTNQLSKMHTFSR
jgi:hypothetical protein